MIQTKNIKIDDNFWVPEEKFLWLNIGFNRLKDMFLSLQPEEGWYRKIKIDLDYYFNICKKNISNDEIIIKKHQEELEKVGFVKDFYLSEDYFEMEQIFTESLFIPNGNEEFNLKLKNINEKIEQGSVYFKSYKEFQDIMNTLKTDDAGLELSNIIIKKGYQEAFGIDKLKMFLLEENNWKGLDSNAQKSLIKSIIKIIYFFDEEQKNKIIDFVSKYATRYFSEFYETIDKKLNDIDANRIYSYLNNFTSENYIQILNFIEKPFEKPIYIKISENGLIKLDEQIFYFVEKIIKEIEKKYKKQKVINNFDFWNERLFKLLWMLCILGFKRLYYSYKK
ncbi:MAG: hypothetical protein N3E50_02005 [Candidatus Goldbacteria bacterium]|nr:hypothetical protein [Candidatus Goldiibacteriota bacterium]